ncbi:hypothetical protein CR513_28264, partial [Mucuna pruriens]
MQYAFPKPYLKVEPTPPLMNRKKDATKSLLGAWEQSNMLSLNLMSLTMVTNVKHSMMKTLENS